MAPPKVPRLALERVPKYAEEGADDAPGHSAGQSDLDAPRESASRASDASSFAVPTGASRREVLLQRLEDFFLRRHQLLLGSVLNGWRDLCDWRSADDDDDDDDDGDDGDDGDVDVDDDYDDDHDDHDGADDDEHAREELTFNNMILGDAPLANADADDGSDGDIRFPRLTPTDDGDELTSSPPLSQLFKQAGADIADTLHDVREVGSPTPKLGQVVDQAVEAASVPYLVPVGTPAQTDNPREAFPGLDGDGVGSAQRRHIAEMAQLKAENERLLILARARGDSSAAMASAAATAEETRRAFGAAMDSLERAASAASPSPLRTDSPTFEGEALLASTSKIANGTPVAIKSWLEAPAAAAAMGATPLPAAGRNDGGAPAIARDEEEEEEGDGDAFEDAPSSPPPSVEQTPGPATSAGSPERRRLLSPPAVSSPPERQSNPLYKKPLVPSPGEGSGKKRPPWCPPPRGAVGSPTKTFGGLGGGSTTHQPHTAHRRNQNAPASSQLPSSNDAGGPPRRGHPSSPAHDLAGEASSEPSPSAASRDGNAGSLWRALDKAERGQKLAQSRASAAEDALARRTDELEDACAAAAAASARADELAVRVQELSASASRSDPAALDAALRRAEAAEAEAIRQRDMASRAVAERNRLAAAAERTGTGGGSGGGGGDDTQARRALHAALADAARLRAENAELRRWKDSLGERGMEAAALAADLQAERALRERAEDAVFKLRLALENALHTVGQDTVNESLGTMSPPAMPAF